MIRIEEVFDCDICEQNTVYRSWAEGIGAGIDQEVWRTIDGKLVCPQCSRLIERCAKVGIVALTFNVVTPHRSRQVENKWHKHRGAMSRGKHLSLANDAARVIVGLSNDLRYIMAEDGSVDVRLRLSGGDIARYYRAPDGFCFMEQSTDTWEQVEAEFPLTLGDEYITTVGAS